MGRINTSPRYITDITRTDLLSLRELGVGGNSEKLEKNEVFVTYGRGIRS